MPHKKTKQLFRISGISVLLFFGNIALGQIQNTAILRGAECKTEYFIIRDIVDGFRLKSQQGIQIHDPHDMTAANMLLAHELNYSFTREEFDKLCQVRRSPRDPKAVWISMKIARNPIVLLVNNANNVENLTVTQIQDIFTGKILNWKELGGDDLLIQTACLNDSLRSGLVNVFKKTVLSDNMTIRKDCRMFNVPSHLGYYVKLTPGSITCMSFNSYVKKYGRLLKVNGVEPTEETILESSYPLDITYYITYDKAYEKRLLPFFDYLITDECKALINKRVIADIDSTVQINRSVSAVH